MNNKRGMSDSIYVPLFILVTACTIFVAMEVWDTFRVNFAVTVADSAANSTIVDAMNDIQVSYQNFDYMFPFIVGGLLIGSLIFAYKSGASIVYAFMSIIFWGLALLFAAVFTNVFGLFQETFPTQSTTFPIIVYIMNNMKWIALGWAFLISVVMFSRTKSEDTGMAASERAFSQYG